MTTKAILISLLVIVGIFCLVSSCQIREREGWEAFAKATAKNPQADQGNELQALCGCNHLPQQVDGEPMTRAWFDAVIVCCAEAVNVNQKEAR